VYDIFILFFSFAISRRIGVSHHPSMSNSTNTNTNNTTMTAGFDQSICPEEEEKTGGTSWKICRI